MTSHTPYHLGFVGPSGSGKTTLIEAVLPCLTAQGLRVAVVKHTHHKVEMDAPGKDSWRFDEAGANRVILATPERVFVQARLARAGEEDYLGGLAGGADLVIHEGGRWLDHPKVLVRETAAEARERGTQGAVLAVVGASTVDAGVPAFHRDDVEGVATLISSLAPARGAEPSFDSLLDQAVAAHGHLCPGQVLGVRMTIAGLHGLGLSIPPPRKRLLAFIETDRCAADAVASVSGCSLGKRTLRHMDFGKMAATFLDLTTGRAVRVTARDDARDRVAAYVPGAADGHEAQTTAYRLMPDAELLTLQDVRVALKDGDLPGPPRGRRPCSACGEHVSYGREVVRDGALVCRACAGESYYQPL